MENRKEKGLAVNAVLNTTKTVLGIIFPLISFPYVSRVLGVEGIGVYNFSASIVSYFLLIAGLGISTYAIREATQYRDDPEKICEFVSQVFSINVMSTLISYILLVGLIAAFPQFEKYQIAIMVLSIEIVFRTFGVPWLCNIYEDFLFITIRTILIQVLSLIGTFIFVRTNKDLYLYIAIVAFANSAANLVNYLYVRKQYCKFRFTIHCGFRKHLKPILIIFSTTIAISVYVSSDTTMIGLMKDDIQVGLYSTSVKIYTIAKNVLAAILMVLIPRFSLYFSTNRRSDAEKLLSEVFNILTMLMLPLAAGMILLSKEIIILISGNAYIEAHESLKLLSVAIIFSLYSYMFVQCILIPVKKEKTVFYATVLSATVNVLLNIILIPIWSINAAAFTTIIAEAIVLFVSFYVGREYATIHVKIKDFLSYTVGCAVIVIICIIVKNHITGIMALIISVFLSIVGYGGVLLLFKNSIVLKIIKNTTNRLSVKKHM